MIAVTGIGWVNLKEYGCIIGKYKKSHNGFDSLHSCFMDESIFLYPVKSIKRFDIISRTTCYSVALALKDAGISYSHDHKKNIGILGANEEGCLESNINYYKDYIDCGRIKARGNLFIYTLPSTPLAEAAIHFGLSGPLLHMSFKEKRISFLLNFAGKSIIEEEVSATVAVKAEKSNAVSFVLEKKEDLLNTRDLALENVIAAAEKTSFDEMIEALEEFCEDKADLS